MRKSLFVIVFLLIMSITGCTTVSPASALATPTGIETSIIPTEADAQTDSSLNLLIVADGEVLLKRDGWSDYHPTAFGAELHHGDQLRPGDGASAIVLCDGITTWAVPAGVPSGLTNGCPQPREPVLLRGESLIGGTRGGDDPLIPYIISPRATRLLTLTPTLRWNAVEGATSYTVNLQGGDLDWTREVADTEIVYPADEPALESNTWYSMIIMADNGESSEAEGVVGLGFSPLPPEEIGRVQSVADKLPPLNLSEDAAALALAQLYTGNGLLSEAIEILEARVAAGNPPAAIYRALGYIYKQVGLLLQAEIHYLSAIDLTEQTNDLEGLAEAQAGLGEVYIAQDIKKEHIKYEAVRWLEQARDGFKALGDADRVDEIEAQLAGFE